ncbi:MAG: histidine kinase [Bacteroidia bacterium]|jgi:hypothetical protein|nr:histidine kinase [Bacteroidia bacterium]
MNQVKHTYSKYIQLLGSRIALNSYFWIFLFILKISDADDQHIHSNLFYYSIILFYMLFFVILSYVNNLVLLPKLLFQQKRLLYILTSTALVLMVSFAYTYCMKWIPIAFADPGLFEMSIIMTPVTNDMSLLGILSDTTSYFPFMVVWVVLFTLLGYYHFSVAKNKQLQALVNEHRAAELAFLKGQLNPHFLFNTLNNLYGLALKKSDETPDAILRLSSILRYILYDSNIDQISFEKEKEILLAYVDIELLRINETPKTQFSIMADKPYFIPPLLWLPIVENIFKHTRNMAELEVDFQLTIVQNQMHLKSTNNIVATAQNQIGGVGLGTLKKRLALLFPNKYSLETTITENYFTIEMHIQLS